MWAIIATINAKMWGGDFIAHMSMREAILMTANIDILVPMTEADLDFQSQRWD